MADFFKRFLSVLCVLLTTIHAKAEDEMPSTNILIINSYSPIQDRINKVLPAYLDNIDIYPNILYSIEYMCCKQTPDYNRWMQWMEMKLDLYATYPDLVVILGQEAWSVYKTVCPNDWKQIPIILGNTPLSYIDYPLLCDSTTILPSEFHSVKSTFEDFRIKGYYYKTYIPENAELIHRLQPDIKRISLLSDNPYGQKVDRTFLNTIKIPNLYINNLNNDDDADEIIRQIKRYPENNTILCNEWETDIVSTYPHACHLIRSEFNKLDHNVAYTVMDGDFNNPSLLGGYFVSGKDLGQDLAKLTEQMLSKGFDQCPNFCITPSEPQYYINAKALARIGYSENEVYFSKMNMINSYSSQLFAKHQLLTVCLIVISIALIVVTFMFLYFRRKCKKNQYYLSRQIERYTSSIPDMVVIINADYKVQEVYNPLSCFNIFKDEETVGNSLDFIMPKLIHLSLLDEIKRNIDHVIGAQVSLSGIYVITLPDEKKRYIQYTLAPFEKDSVICYQRNTTQHVRSKFKMDDAHKIMQTVLNAVPIAISIKNADNDFKYVMCNKRFEQMQASNEEIVGKSDSELANPDAAKIMEEDKQTLFSNSPILFKRSVYNEEQEFLWEEQTCKMLLNSKGKRYIIAISQNSTPESRDKYELQYLRHELNIALKTGMFFMWTYNFKTRNFTTLHFFNRFTVSLERFYRNIEYADQVKVGELLHNIEVGIQKSGSITLKYKKNKEQSCWYKFYFSSVNNKHSQAPEQIIIVSQDVTQEKQDLSDYEYSRNCAKIALQASGFTSWQYNLLTKEFSSESPLSIFYGRMSHKSYLQHIHPDDRTLVKDIFSDLVLEKHNSANIRVRYMMNTGKTYRWIEINAIRLSSSDSSSRMSTVIVGTHRDVTDEQESKNTLTQIQNALKESNDDKYAFISSVCSNLRSSLNSILEFSSLLIESNDRNEKEEFVKIINANHQTLSDLINNLSDIARLKTGKMQFHPYPVKVNDIINYLIQSYALKIDDAIGLSTSMPAVSCSVHCDKIRLTQVISTAIKYAIGNIKEGNVCIGYRYDLSDIHIFVKSIGKVVVRPQNLYEECVGVTFYTNSNPNIDLSICKNIVEQMGGNAGYSSINDNEYELFINLPARMIVDDTRG